MCVSKVYSHHSKKLLIVVLLTALFFSCKMNPEQIDTIYENKIIYGINDLCFINSKEGFLCGENGVILKTSDKGINWTHRSYPNYPWDNDEFLRLKFLDDSSGWAVGGTNNSEVSIYMTKNKTTWSKLSHNLIKGYCFDFAFSDKSNGFLLVLPIPFYRYEMNYYQPPPNLYHTVDGGITWSKMTLPDMYLKTIDFFNDSSGIMLASLNSYYTTFDAGKTWRYNKFEDKFELRSIISTREAKFIFGNQNFFYKSYDNGKTWEKETINIVNPTLSSLYMNSPLDVSFIDAQTGAMLISESTETSQTYLITRDGGLNWTRKLIRIEKNTMIRKLKLIDETNAVGSTYNRSIFRIKY